MKRGYFRVAIAMSTAPWLLAASSAAQPAEDAASDEFFLEIPPPETAFPIAALEAYLVPASLPESAQMRLKSVIRDTALPDTSQGPISVCFHDGTDALARRVAQAARAWEVPGSSVAFDFGDPASPRRCTSAPGATIRVSFNGIGTWSLVGLESRFANDATMNFDQGRDWLALGQRDFNRIVQHEFGHALGLYHEHQHPAVKCSEEIDWAKAIALYRGANYNLSEEVIRKNFEVLLTSYEASGFDQDSIMLYDIPRSIFRSELFAGESKPACYVGKRVYDISAGDIAMIVKYYSEDRQRVRAMRRAAFENYRALVGSAEGGDKALAVASAFYAFDDIRDARPYVAYGQNLMRLESQK